MGGVDSLAVQPAEPRRQARRSASQGIEAAQICYLHHFVIEEDVRGGGGGGGGERRRGEEDEDGGESTTRKGEPAMY